MFPTHFLYYFFFHMLSYINYDAMQHLQVLSTAHPVRRTRPIRNKNIIYKILYLYTILFKYDLVLGTVSEARRGGLYH
ncbi:MAG: hypothetical protein ACI90V_006328 [Bacillariaceae sp.]|jgi:hypothetical protein